MIWLLGDLAHDWYAAGVIRGIDAAAEEHGLAIELLGETAQRRPCLLERKYQMTADGPPPDVESLHWRGRSYNRFNGTTWSRSNPNCSTSTLV